MRHIGAVPTPPKLAARVAAAAALLALTASACLPRTEPAESGDDAPVVTHSGRDVINVLELSDQSVAGLDAYQVVQRLRPNFLAQYAGVGPTQVSVDGSPLTPLSSLKNFRADALMEIRLLSATEAAQRFGPTSNRGAVILVRLK